MKLLIGGTRILVSGRVSGMNWLTRQCDLTVSDPNAYSTECTAVCHPASLRSYSTDLVYSNGFFADINYNVRIQYRAVGVRVQYTYYQYVIMYFSY